MGLFYAANIVGGVAGCLLAGFFLLRVYDLYVATFVAVGLNAAVAAVSFALASRARFDSRAPSALALPSVYAHRAVYIVIALSGLASLGAQVVWTRLLSLVFGATVYTFTIILAVFLAGLGIGSAAGSFLVRHVKSPRAVLGWCQLSLVAAIPFCAYMICLEFPYWQINPEFRSNLAQRYLHDLVRGILAMLPATCIWGASFPLALAAAAEDGQEPGHLVGGLYAANTAGAILGALLFSTVMIPGVGTQASQQILTDAGRKARLVDDRVRGGEVGRPTCRRRRAFGRRFRWVDGLDGSRHSRQRDRLRPRCRPLPPDRELPLRWRGKHLVHHRVRRRGFSIRLGEWQGRGVVRPG
jgi:spermidine synthase